MTIDHYGKIVAPVLYTETNAIGRLAFPLFAWIIGTRLGLAPDLDRKYLSNLLIWAGVSQPAFVFAGNSWMSPNILFTLALGVGLHVSLRMWLSERSVAGGFLLSGAIILAFFLDYGPFGVFMIPVTAYLARRSMTMAAGWSGPLGALSNVVPAAPYIGPGAVLAVFASGVALVSMKLNYSLPRLPKYFFYAFYPLHLILLRLIATYFPA